MLVSCAEMEETQGIVTVGYEREIQILCTQQGTGNASDEQVWKSLIIFLRALGDLLGVKYQ